MYQALVPGLCYHIYNRGINKETLFREPENYDQFLDKYKKYCSGVFNTFAYNLLGNHFHFVVQVKGDLDRRQSAQDILLNPSLQLSHLFNSYAQSFNCKYKRTGGLFERPFHRRQLFTDAYLSSAIFYTHNNAAKHGFVKRITDWPYSSYHDLLGDHETFLSRQMVLDWFGGREQFISFHHRPPNITGLNWSEI